MQADKPTFAIVVQEKGGAERREVFQSVELSVGRVHGNDLTLPKGNVSKRHARLLFRDGRFIVTDLNSTNGTYVNRRRISQATIVREGDRIYIGDFVLRIEAATEEDTEAMRGKAARDASHPTPSQQGRPLVSIRAAGQRPSFTGGYSDVPGAPAIPGGASVVAATMQPEAPREESERAGPPSPPVGIVEPEQPSPSASPGDDAVAWDAPSVFPKTAHQGALRALLERVDEAVAPGALDKEIDDRAATRFAAILQDQFEELVNEGELPEGVNHEQLLADARLELLEMGPLTPLLADDQVSEVRILHHSVLFAMRADRLEPVAGCFSSDAGLRRTLNRLCQRAGHELAEHEAISEYELRDGLRMTVARSAATRGRVAALLRRARPVSATLEALTDSGVLDRPIAQLLRELVFNHFRMLIAGPVGAGVAELVSACCQAADHEPWALLTAKDNWAPGLSLAARFDGSGDELEVLRMVELARRLGNRVAVDLELLALVDMFPALSADGVGIIAQARARTAGAALRRLVGRLYLSSPSGDAARSLANSIDVVVEVAADATGQSRLMRIAEPALGPDGNIELQDIFWRHATDGDVQFTHSGQPSRCLEELRQLGITIDNLPS